MSDRSRHTCFAAQATRERLQAFLAARFSSEADARAVLARHLARAVRWSQSLAADTSLVARWQQALRHAIVEHVRSGVSPHARDRAWQAIVAISHAHHHPTLAACFAPLIAELPVDEAVMLHHVQILGQPLDDAARELGHAPATAAALLARAESRLGACLDAIFDATRAEDCPLPAPKEFSRHTLSRLRAEHRLARTRASQPAMP